MTSLPIWMTEGSKVAVNGKTYTVAHRGAWSATLRGPRGGEMFVTENANGLGLFISNHRTNSRVETLEAL